MAKEPVGASDDGDDEENQEDPNDLFPPEVRAEISKHLNVLRTVLHPPNAPDILDALEPGVDGPIPGYGEYELDVESVLREKLPPFFDFIERTPLTTENVAAIPDRAKGAYLLYYGDDPMPVYAGKTDAEHGFRMRLDRHAWTVQGRQDLDPAEMSFKAVRIMVFAALDVEALLIRRLKQMMPGALRWNNSGFGSNDPGRNRDGQKPARFDQEFPIDIDFRVDDMPWGGTSVVHCLETLKAGLPYLLRYSGVPPHLTMGLLPQKPTARTVLQAVMDTLPPGFQCTILHGRVVLYHESKRYQYKLEVMRSD